MSLLISCTCNFYMRTMLCFLLTLWLLRPSYFPFAVYILVWFCVFLALSLHILPCSTNRRFTQYIYPLLSRSINLALCLAVAINIVTNISTSFYQKVVMINSRNIFFHIENLWGIMIFFSISNTCMLKHFLNNVINTALLSFLCKLMFEK